MLHQPYCDNKFNILKPCWLFCAKLWHGCIYIFSILYILLLWLLDAVFRDLHPDRSQKYDYITYGWTLVNCAHICYLATSLADVKHVFKVVSRLAPDWLTATLSAIGGYQHWIPSADSNTDYHWPKATLDVFGFLKRVETASVKYGSK